MRTDRSERQPMTWTMSRSKFRCTFQRLDDNLYCQLRLSCPEAQLTSKQPLGFSGRRVDPSGSQRPLDRSRVLIQMIQCPSGIHVKVHGSVEQQQVDRDFAFSYVHYIRVSEESVPVMRIKKKRHGQHDAYQRKEAGERVKVQVRCCDHQNMV